MANLIRTVIARDPVTFSWGKGFRDAALFDEREAAEIAMVAYGDHGGWIEEVTDVGEFRAREDTW